MNGNPATAASGSAAPPPPPDTASAVPHTQPQTFHCVPCGRTIVTRESAKHLGGKPHRAAIEAQQRKALAAEQRRKKQLAPPAAAPTGGAKYGAWECVVCQREMVRATRASHLAGAPHARMVLLEKEKQEKAARMALAEKEKGENAERALAQAAAAKKADDDWAAVEKEFKDRIELEVQRAQAEMDRQEADRVAEIERLALIERLAEIERRAEIERLAELERIAELERAAREEQERMEKAAEVERRRQRDKEEQEIALVAERQRDLILEVERQVQLQRELHKESELQQQQEYRQLKQMKRKERKAARLNAAIASSSMRAAVAPTNGESEGRTGRSRAMMVEFMQAQNFLRCSHLNSPVAQHPTTEYERTGLLPMYITSPADLPPILYRVYDATSMSQFTSGGFSASVPRLPYHPMTFRGMVERHANWSSRGGTPFVSVTSSADAARWHVSKKRETGLATGVMVALIDTAALLRTTQVWRMHDAMDHFGVPPAMCERRAYDNEYICAVSIPASAVVACCQPEYYMDMAYVFLKKVERVYAARAQIGGRVVVTIRAPDADAEEAVAHGPAYWGQGYEIERIAEVDPVVEGGFCRRRSV